VDAEQALKFHPDRNQENKVEAEAAFKEVSEAYSVLSDPQKRAGYDSFGSAGAGAGDFGRGFGASPFAGGFGGQPVNMEQAERLFREMFGSMHAGGGAAGAAGLHNLFKQLNMQDMFEGGGGGGGGVSSTTEQSVFTNSRGELVQRTRTRVRKADGSVEERVVERVLRSR
jgi:DnaJ-class molecular chaperone